MSKKVKIWGSVIALVVVVLAVTAFLMKDRLLNGNADGMEEFDEPVMVQAVEKQQLGESILVTGEIIPSDEQKVFVDAANGEVKEFFVTENQQVEVGTPLFTYDVTKINSEYAKAVRSRELTQKRLAISVKELEAARKRVKDMKKNPELTDEEINTASKEVVQAEMDIEGIKDEVSSIQETINELTISKEKMIVKSKIDGVVVKLNKNIEPSEGGSTEPSVHIISSGPLKVIGTMSEFDTVKIKPEQAVVIRPKVFKDRTWEGTVESVSQFPNSEGGDEYSGGGGNVTMYPFKVTIAGDTSELRQGFHVSLEINISDLEQGEQLAVPHTAIDMDEEGAEFVYVVTKENILEKRYIAMGDVSDEYAGIVEGVELGEWIVINPFIIQMKNLEVDQEVKDFVNLSEGMEEVDVEAEEVDGESAPEETEPEQEEGSQNDEAQ